MLTFAIVNSIERISQFETEQDSAVITPGSADAAVEAETEGKHWKKDSPCRQWRTLDLHLSPRWGINE